MRPLLIALLSALCIAHVHAQDPFGWCTCATSDTHGDYQLTGGGSGRVTVIRADSDDMTKAVTEAIRRYDVIIFDGSAGDFIFSTKVSLNGMRDKTLAGVNNALLRTKFTVTDDVKSLLDDLGVKSMSSNSADGGGGTLVNGATVAEECEYNIRKALIEYWNDPTEKYRQSGIFECNSCENLIIRNLSLVGPGALDVGGSDIVTLNGCRHVWVDHCHFTDGLDGNMDITSGSDFITVSWCVFDYTSRTYNHPLSNLISGQTGIDEGKLNITWAYCKWGDGCNSRLPWVHFGTNHILNCLYQAPKATCIRVSDGARLRVEGCDFDPSVRRVYQDTGTGALKWINNVHPAHERPADIGVVEMGYAYNAMPVIDVIPVVGNSDTGAGATLGTPFTRGITCVPSALTDLKLYTGVGSEYILNISAFPPLEGHVECTVTATEGILLSADGESWSQAISLGNDNGSTYGIISDILVKIMPDAPGTVNGEISVICADETFRLPVAGYATSLGEALGETTLTWSLDNGTADGVTAACPLLQVFDNAACSVGPALFIKGTVTPVAGPRMTTFNPYDPLPKYRVEDAYVKFTVTAADGYVFMPSSMTLGCSRVGTDMGAVDVVAVCDDATVPLLIGVQPERSSTSPTGYSTYDISLTHLPASDTFDIYVYLYNLSANKQIALGDINISGNIFRSDAGIGSCVADPAQTDTHLYDLRGIRVNKCLPRHLYISRKSKILQIR